MNQENKKTKMAIVLVGNQMQISVALGYLKEAKISSDELFVVAPVVSSDELKDRLTGEQSSSTDIKDVLANNIVQTSEENLTDLEILWQFQRLCSLSLKFQDLIVRNMLSSPSRKNRYLMLREKSAVSILGQKVGIDVIS